MFAKKPVICFLLLCGLALLLPQTGRAATDQELLQQSREKIKAFAQKLKGEFKKGMKAGGPLTAIGVCSEKAPGIANTLARETGWMIRRVSLKTRNPQNRPDRFETEILRKWEQGEKGEEQYKTVEVMGRKEFRYMKLIRLNKLCTKCHGPAEGLKPEIRESLKKHYPHDQATGYRAGDVRGAFSVRIPQ